LACETGEGMVCFLLAHAAGEWRLLMEIKQT